MTRWGFEVYAAHFEPMGRVLALHDGIALLDCDRERRRARDVLRPRGDIHRVGARRCSLIMLRLTASTAAAKPDRENDEQHRQRNLAPESNREQQKDACQHGKAQRRRAAIEL